MIKKTLKIFFAVLFLILKKIFIKENRVPNKKMDNFSNKLHSAFLYTSFPALFLLWFDIYISSFSINTAIYIIMFLQLVVITRYFNPKMLEKKHTQIKILKNINKLSLFIFIANWIIFTFGFAFAFLIVLLLNNILYILIIGSIEKMKEQEEFKKQFGEGNYSTKDIIKTHIENLFERDIPMDQLTKSDIKRQYRTMAKKYHPDVYEGDEKEKFHSINQSYKFLIDIKIKEQNNKEA